MLGWLGSRFTVCRLRPQVLRRKHGLHSRVEPRSQKCLHSHGGRLGPSPKQGLFWNRLGQIACPAEWIAGSVSKYQGHCRPRKKVKITPARTQHVALKRAQANDACIDISPSASSWAMPLERSFSSNGLRRAPAIRIQDRFCIVACSVKPTAC